MKLKNLKKITVTVSDISIPPLGEIKINDKKWKQLWKLKEFRESINLNYLEKIGNGNKITDSTVKED